VTSGASSSGNRISIEELEQKKLAARISPSSQRLRRKLSLEELENEKKVAAGQRQDSFSAERLTPAVQRKLSVEKKLAGAGRSDSMNDDSFSEHRRSPTKKPSLSELEAEKKMALSGGSNITSEERRTSSRNISAADLEAEKKIAAAGVVGSGSFLQARHAFMRSRTSSRTSSRGSDIASKDGKIITDQAGRHIDLDAEFAQLHSGNFEPGSQDRAQIESVSDTSGPDYMPGAIAVYSADYEGIEDLEPDYINPDNFHGEKGMYDDSDNRGANEFSNVQTAPVVPEENPGQNILFPGTKRGSMACPIVIMVVVVIAVAVGVSLAVTGSRGGGVEPTSVPTSMPTTVAPSVSPTFVAPTRSLQPSPTPSSAPTLSQWTVQGEIRGPGFGETVQLAENIIAISNNSSIFTFEYVDSVWEPINETIDGDLVRLSDTKRIAVRREGLVRAYDLLDGNWTQVGNDIVGNLSPDAISISGDGFVIAVSSLLSVTQHRCRVYRFDGSSWTQSGDDISVTDFFQPLVRNALTFDGSLVAIGFDNLELGFSLAYRAPPFGSTEWEPTLLGLEVYGGGPSIALSRDGQMVVTGGNGFVNVFDINREPIGSLINLDGAGVNPEITVSKNVTRLAYAWQANLRVVELLDHSWLGKGVLPSIQFDITSISFSSDGTRLAVGQPGGNLVQILEISG
jgi:hypothetical protein